MTRQDLVAFARRQRYAVEASTAASGHAQAAVIGMAVTDAFELVFDTLESTRKCANLRRDPRTALVVWDEACTLQIEGLADEPAGEELARLKRVYFERFADGPERESWPGITYFRVRPRWARYSDFSGSEPRIVELGADVLLD